MATVYGWKSGARISHKADAQIVGERLAEIGRRKALTASVVVEDAKSKRSPLHPLFEWDNDKAAEAFRLDQARDVLASVIVVRPDLNGTTPDPVRAFVALSQPRVLSGMDDEDNLEVPLKAYRHIDDVLANPLWRAEMLAIIKGELSAARRKYKAFTELAAVWDAVDRVAS